MMTVVWLCLCSITHNMKQAIKWRHSRTGLRHRPFTAKNEGSSPSAVTSAAKCTRLSTLTEQTPISLRHNANVV